MSVHSAPAGGAVRPVCSELSGLFRVGASSGDAAGGLWEMEEGVGGARGEEREEWWIGRHGVLAVGPGSPGVPGVPSALVSSTVSRLSCRERSAEEESSTEVITEVSPMSGPRSRGGAGLSRVTPSSPLMVSTRRLHDRPK